MKTLALVAACLATPAIADAPEVVAAKATRNGDTWRFDVTLRHPDTGWDHYADGWEILSPEGQALGYRELLHPHETEQPFTRSLAGVAVPNGSTHVFVRARDNHEEWSDGSFRLNLE